MSGYGASARIVPSAPRLAGGSPTDAWRQTEHGATPSAAIQLIDTIGSEPVGPMETDDGRIAAIRERWSQLTFFLFDPNSWRS